MIFQKYFLFLVMTIWEFYKVTLLGADPDWQKRRGLSVINAMKHMLSGQITNLPPNIAW